LGGLVQLAEHAYDFVGRGVLERDDLDFLRAGLVHALDEVEHAPHVLRAIRDDQCVRRLVSREMRGLRQQRPQDRHELRCADVVEHDGLSDVIVARAETRVRIGNDLNGVAGVERHEAVNFERRQEQTIESFRRHRRVRQHRDLSADARVDDDRAADDLLDLLRDHADVGVAVVGRELRPLLAVRLRTGEACKDGGAKHRAAQRPALREVGRVAAAARAPLRVIHSRFSWRLCS
jgi:hypothetical protein